jgi:hypothetical protein
LVEAPTDVDVLPALALLGDLPATFPRIDGYALAWPRPRAEVLSALHANIQDVFNENGVQIMSPHYLGDPDDAKVVPPSRWAPPLAPTGAVPASAPGGPGRPPPA